MLRGSVFDPSRSHSTSKATTRSFVRLWKLEDLHPHLPNTSDADQSASAPNGPCQTLPLANRLGARSAIWPSNAWTKDHFRIVKTSCIVFLLTRECSMAAKWIPVLRHRPAQPGKLSTTVSTDSVRSHLAQGETKHRSRSGTHFAFQAHHVLAVRGVERCSRQDLPHSSRSSSTLSRPTRVGVEVGSWHTVRLWHEGSRSAPHPTQNRSLISS